MCLSGMPRESETGQSETERLCEGAYGGNGCLLRGWSNSGCDTKKGSQVCVVGEQMNRHGEGRVSQFCCCIRLDYHKGNI